MKKNTSAEPKPVNESRRRFLTTVALGASAAPFLSLSRGLLAQPAAPTDSGLCYSNKRVLGPTDFRYLGAMRVPLNVDMAFSGGQLTGRKVGGAVQLLMVGNVVAGDPIYEFADTGNYNVDDSLAPRMPLVRSWGNIYGNARRTWKADGTEKVGYPRYPGALHWSEAKQLLYWTYIDTYNTTGDEDWCLGATRLDSGGPVAFGPWRPSGEGRKGPWRCIRVSEHPVTGELLCGSGVMSGSANSPWGPDLWAGQFPTASTPGGYGAPDIPIQKYVTYYPMYGHINPNGSYTGPVKASRRPGDYVFEPINGSGLLTEIDPTKNGGVGSWTQLDGLSGSAWIDLPDAHGVVFTGRLAAGHVWYRNAGQGNDLCTHGLASPVQVTGPVSTDAYPAFIIYDPADLDAVRTGKRVDYTVDPVHFVNARETYGTKTAPITAIGVACSLGGSYFDPASRKLYVAAAGCDVTIPGLFNPLVHVFQVA